MSDNQITIVCPTCQTYFHISRNSLGSQGRTVRCTVCQKVWFERSPKNPPQVHKDSISRALLHSQKPLRNIERSSRRLSESAPIYKTFPENLTYSTQMTRNGTFKLLQNKKLLLIALLGLCFLAGLTYLNINKTYMYSADSPRLINLTWQSHMDTNNTSVTINAATVNISDTPCSPPKIDAVIVSSNGSQEKSWPITLQLTGPELSPGETRPFSVTTTVSAPVKVLRITCQARP